MSTNSKNLSSMGMPEQKRSEIFVAAQEFFGIFYKDRTKA
jgi:hypothetical protein